MIKTGENFVRMNGTLSWHYGGASHAQVMTSEIPPFFTAELGGHGGRGSLLSLSHIALKRANIRDSKSGTIAEPLVSLNPHSLISCSLASGFQCRC